MAIGESHLSLRAMEGDNVILCMLGQQLECKVGLALLFFPLLLLLPCWLKIKCCTEGPGREKEVVFWTLEKYHSLYSLWLTYHCIRKGWYTVILGAVAKGKLPINKTMMSLVFPPSLCRRQYRPSFGRNLVKRCMGRITRKRKTRQRGTISEHQDYSFVDHFLWLGVSWRPYL